MRTSHARLAAPPAPAQTPSAEHYLERGQTATAARDLHAAVISFRKAAYLRPDDPEIALHLAFALESLGDAEGARPWFRRALETMALAGPDAAVLEGWSTPELRFVIERKVTAMESGR